MLYFRSSDSFPISFSPPSSRREEKGSFSCLNRTAPLHQDAGGRCRSSPFCNSKVMAHLSFHPPLLLLAGLVLLPTLAAAQSPYRNVSLGSSLTPRGPNTSWLSPSGDFAFGFLPFDPENGTFLLAIWFDKMVNKTVVWSAKADTPLLVLEGSTAELQTSGRLALKDQTGKEVWTANGDAAGVSHAAMLDTGNFVLVGGGIVGSGGYVWESFDYPTDTILPTQELRLDQKIVAHLMDNDYSDGRFKLAVQTDGDLVLYHISVTSGDEYSPYWSTKTADSGSRLVFNSAGNLYMAQKDDGVVNVTSGSVSAEEFYQRATLDPDGVLRHYTYPRNATREGNWGQGWSVAMEVPLDICASLVSQKGGGACGYNAYCAMGDQRTNCQCPPGYSFLDPGRRYRGCAPDFPLPGCGAVEDAQYQIVQMLDTDWPLSDYEQWTNFREDDCRAECLGDCFCAAAIYGGENRGTCWKKKLPLTNGRVDSRLGKKALLKIFKGNTTTTGSIGPYLPPTYETKRRYSGISVVAGSLILGSSLLLNLLFMASVVFFCCWSRKRLRGWEQQEPSTNTMGMIMRPFTYKELEEATEGFKEELGRGGFGIVYKGALPPPSGAQIAVKKLSNLEPSAEKEFMNEVRAIGQTHHKNLVRLLGFCNEGPNRLLVYEFQSNGSLNGLLFGSSRPSWTQRTQIAYGIARGLLYLHEECTTQIIHCDIKPQNVLLDECLVPKISDFGLAKLLRTGQTRTNTGIRGTKGYVAAEWFKSMPVTAKVDVYSFGVMLLEIVCCRKNVEPAYGDGVETILTDWAYDCYREGRLDALIENDEDAIADFRRVERFVMVALWCIQDDPALRPSMKKVTQILEGAVEVSVPPNPMSFISSIS